MGYIAHNAIVVTSWNDETIEKAHAKATELRCSVSNIVASPVNGYKSFLIAPDGSKEGWGDSDVGDAQRKAWIAWSKDLRYEDGSSSLHWCEVRFGSDDADAQIVTHEWADAPAEGRSPE